jgi:chromatin remodeling complex protein RSC6
MPPATEKKLKKTTKVEDSDAKKAEKKAEKKAKKKADKKADKKATVEETVVEETVVEETVVEETVVEETAPVELAPGPIIAKGIPTKDSVLNSYDLIIASIEAEVNSIRSGDTKGGGIKFLKNLNSNLKKLQKQTARIAKGKSKKSETPNTNSGFLKPVEVSDDVRKFAGWNKDELHSRVDVTKFICNYVKENNLQNPEDRRRIIPDAKLKKLLGSSTKDLRYCDIQTLMKPHFGSK